MENDIFSKARDIIRANPSEHQVVVQGVIARILAKNNLKPATVLTVFVSAWKDSKHPKERITIAWLLTDSTIGTGEPHVDAALASALLEKIFIEDESLNPEPLQGWIAGVIFAGEGSKKRLQDSITAVGTKDFDATIVLSDKELTLLYQLAGNFGKSFTRAELSAKTDIPSSTVKDCLDRLIEKGLVAKAKERGGYYAIQKGFDFYCWFQRKNE